MRVVGFRGLVAGSKSEEVVEQTWCAPADSGKDHQFGTAERQSVLAIGSVQGGQNEGHAVICLTYCQRFEFC